MLLPRQNENELCCNRGHTRWYQHIPCVHAFPPSQASANGAISSVFARVLTSLKWVSKTNNLYSSPSSPLAPNGTDGSEWSQPTHGTNHVLSNSSSELVRQTFSPPVRMSDGTTGATGHRKETAQQACLLTIPRAHGAFERSIASGSDSCCFSPAM